MTMIMQPVKRYGASSIAALHISGISTGFISSLGQEFVTALYEAIAESIADGVRKFLKMSPQELDAIGKNGGIFYQQELCLAFGSKKLEKVLRSAVKWT